MTTPPLIDTHCHIDTAPFDKDRNEVIKEALKNNIIALVNIGATDGLEGAKRTIKLANSFQEIYASVGIHPHDADQNLDFSNIVNMANGKKVVAIGETGLDFYKEWADKKKQIALFEKHIELALNINKPLVIHCRNASSKIIEILKSNKAEKVGGVFHCFSEDFETAQKIFNLNFIVSISGIVTFKNSLTLKNAVKKIPAEKIMVETDSPYLAPAPFRGKRCEPKYVSYTAKAIAEIKQINLSNFAKISTNTAINFFNLQNIKDN